MSKVLNKYVISEPFASVTALKAFDTSLGDAVDAGVLANVLVDNASSEVATSNLYAYSILCTTAGNDDTIVTPDNVTEPAAGRWLKITDRTIAGIIANNEHGYFGADTGAANAYVVNVAGTLGSYGTGLRLWVLIGSGNTNTGASTINVDSIGVANIKTQDGNDPVAGDLVADKIAHLVYDGTNFQLLNPLVTGGVDVDGFYATDAGAADAYDGTIAESPAIAAGLRVWLNVANPNTGASTMTVNGGAAASIKLQDGNDPIAGDLAAGKLADLIYDDTNWQLLNPRISLSGTRDAGSTNITSINALELDSIAAPSHSEGLMFYDSTEKTPAFYNDEADVTLNIGQESWVRVRNETGVTITNGQVVYISGAEGGGENRPLVSLAQADAQATSQVLGIATHDIETATYGWVTRFGLVNDLNTASFSPGDAVYLSTSSAGGLQNTQPVSPDFAVFMGVVSISNASTGQIVLFPSNEALAGAAGSATQLTLPVRKDSAGTINAGKVVYVTGYNAGADVVLVEEADASSSSTMPAIGFTTASVTNSTTVDAILFGRVASVVDTSSFTVGDTLYVSETTGAVTNVKPTGTALIQNIGVVVRSNASNGVIQAGGSGRTNDLPNIASANFWVGNGSGVPTAVTMSGDATMDNTGAVTVSAVSGTGLLIQAVSGSSTAASTSTALPFDNTTPQNTEGAELMTVSITPTNASNRLRITAYAMMDSTPTGVGHALALFQDSTADALAVQGQQNEANNRPNTVVLCHEMAAGTVSSTTFKIRFGNNSGATCYVGQQQSGGLFNSLVVARIFVEEIGV